MPLLRVESRAPRVVLDTNVVLSTLIFGGATAAIRRAWQDGRCVPLASAATTSELLRVLAYPKFQLSVPEQEELLAEYLPYTAAVRITDARSARSALPICRDPFDIPFLQLAVAGRARVLVSGDRDLLALAGTARFAILTPAAFLATL